MPRAKKAKASKPRKIMAAEIPANDDEARLINVQLRASRAEAARLKAQGGEVNIDKTTGLITGAWRRDVFTILRNKTGKPCDGWPKGKPALSQRSFDAYRAHEADMHLSAGAAANERRPDFIRATTEGAPGQAVTKDALDAGRRVRETMKRLSPPDASLLTDLMDGEKALAAHWRKTVMGRTGETGEEAQTARVRSLGENLHWARTTAIAEIRVAANDIVAREPKPDEPPAVTWFRGADYG